MTSPGVIWRTVRHLKPRQVAYQLINRLRKPAKLCFPNLSPAGHFLHVPEADKPVSWKNGTFTFLNQSVCFGGTDDKDSIDEIDWNYSANGKLWTYNLTYFDFLNQPSLSTEEGLRFIYDFIKKISAIKDGLEPYPTSLRINNWGHFLSRNKIQDDLINAHLFAQVDLLGRRLEYHLGGNHLLENGFALFMGGLYFQEEKWTQTAAALIQAELCTQILDDGGHDERSPMYHQLLLDRLLDVLLVLQYHSWYSNAAFINFIARKAGQMIDWLAGVTFTNGSIPMMNDAASGIATTTAKLLKKAQRFGVTPVQSQLKESGYRMFRTGRYELLADVGSIGPDHQPGHAHADTFSFVLSVDNCPIIVDSGTSTYEVSNRRAWERSTAAHNTVEVNGQSSSEVWSSFRVGRRAQVTVLEDTPTSLSARHDGYQHLSVLHERTWLVDSTQLRITDRLLTKEQALGVARFHFHPDVRVVIDDNKVKAGSLGMVFLGEFELTIKMVDYEMASGFNQLRPAQCIDVFFIHSLQTTVTIVE
ncbi:heparinase II/III family protein [Spirosoma soli]|uniref:Heparinase II/III family protein n=1 Tax=Spirosoma soli TaxID=1770529 RepID=A0ABW5M917_9BACT